MIKLIEEGILPNEASQGISNAPLLLEKELKEIIEKIEEIKQKYKDSLQRGIIKDIELKPVDMAEQTENPKSDQEKLQKQLAVLLKKCNDALKSTLPKHTRAFYQKIKKQCQDNLLALHENKELYLKQIRRPSPKAEPIFNKSPIVTKEKAENLLTEKSKMKAESTFNKLPIAIKEEAESLLKKNKMLKEESFVSWVEAQLDAVRTAINKEDDDAAKLKAYTEFKKVEAACMVVNVRSKSHLLELNDYQDSVNSELKTPASDASVEVIKLYYTMNVIGLPAKTINPYFNKETEETDKDLAEIKSAYEGLHTRKDWEGDAAVSTPQTLDWKEGGEKAKISSQGGRLIVTVIPTAEQNNKGEKFNQEEVKKFIAATVIALNSGKGIKWDNMDTGETYSDYKSKAEGACFSQWKQAVFKNGLTDLSKCMPEKRGNWAEWVGNIDKNYKSKASEMNNDLFERISATNLDDGGKTISDCLLSLIKEYKALGKKSEPLEEAIKKGVMQLTADTSYNTFKDTTLGKIVEEAAKNLSDDMIPSKVAIKNASLLSAKAVD